MRSLDPEFRWVECRGPSPRNRLSRPLSTARVALVGTAGAYLADQRSFSLGIRGDPSYRVIPRDAREIKLRHSGYDTQRASRDPNTVFPIMLLHTLAANGIIGDVAERAFAFMGYVPDPDPLIHQQAPAVVAALIDDAVDLVLLVPS